MIKNGKSESRWPARDPAQYDRWYQTAKGRWMAEREFALINCLLPIQSGESLLDVGCGTGQFSCRYREIGAQVTGLDPQLTSLSFARSKTPAIPVVAGSALSLPYADNSFDVVVAITSLCFVEPPEQALREMWRVSRRAVLLGLLNRQSLLYLAKRGSPGYRGARWDDLRQVEQWTHDLSEPAIVRSASVILLPGGGWLSRRLEKFSPVLPCGGFLAVCWERANN